MYALPNSTLLSKQIPKKAIYQKFVLTRVQRQRIDADIARIDIIARLAQDTLPAIAMGKEVKDIYVLSVSLKTKRYHPDSIKLLARLIPQHILFVLCHEQEAQLPSCTKDYIRLTFRRRTNCKFPSMGLISMPCGNNWLLALAISHAAQSRRSASVSNRRRSGNE